MNIEREAMIRCACYEIGHSLLDGKDPEMELENLGVISQGYGSVRTTYSRTHVVEHIVIAWYDPVIPTIATGSTTSTTVTLDRPLEVAVANGAAAFPGPYGSLNWAFHRDAIALVSRPLARPSAQMGAMSQVGNHNGISMRITAQYDIDAGGTKVNCDLLCGVAVLDSRLCVPLLG